MKKIIIGLMLLLLSAVVIGCSQEEPKEEENKQNEAQEQVKENSKEVNEQLIIAELEDEYLIQKSREVIEKVGSLVTAKSLEEYNQIMNETFVDVEFYSNPNEMDPNVEEVLVKFSNEKISKSISNYYYTADLVFEFKMKNGTTEIGEEAQNTTADFTIHEGKFKILSIQ